MLAVYIFQFSGPGRDNFGDFVSLSQVEMYYYMVRDTMFELNHLLEYSTVLNLGLFKL